MRMDEVKYWDGVASSITKDGAVRDNWLKRQFIGQFLLKCNWCGERVLEIGTGCGASAAMVGVACGRTWDYTGTELSPLFGSIARENFGLNVIQADVLSLPEGPFTRIIALDSLEHVRRDDREQGYRNIAERLAPGGLLLINMPCHRSSHDEDFDHGFDLVDLARLEAEGLRLSKYDRYQIAYGGGRRDYAFVGMVKPVAKA